MNWNVAMGSVLRTAWRRCLRLLCRFCRLARLLSDLLCRSLRARVGRSFRSLLQLGDIPYVNFAVWDACCGTRYVPHHSHYNPAAREIVVCRVCFARNRPSISADGVVALSKASGVPRERDICGDHFPSVQPLKRRESCRRIP